MVSSKGEIFKIALDGHLSTYISVINKKINHYPENRF
jgi:hypothetical protein